MEWIALVTVILELLRPILQAWLENLLKRAAADLDRGVTGPVHYDPETAERRVWDVASALLEADAGELSWWNWLGKWRDGQRRRYFEAARRAALAREGQLYQAAYYPGHPATPLTGDEIRAIQQEG